MFDQRTFWLTFIAIIAGLAVLYAAIDLLVLRRLPDRHRKRDIAINVVLGVALLAVLVLIVDTLSVGLFLQTVLDKILAISVLALATTGIVLIFKTSVTTNFAQGSLATIGAYVAAVALAGIADEAGLSPVATVFVAMGAGAAAAFLIGLGVDVFVIRKAKYVTSVGKQMITMGLVLVFAGLIPLVFGILPLYIHRFSYEIYRFTLFGAALSVTAHAVYGLVIAVVLLGLLFAALRFTKWGLGVRATASSETVAGMMGVNTRLITAMSWAVAGALGGVAAVLYTPFATGEQVTVSLMTATQVNGFMASILGGFSSFGGPIFGTVLIQLLTGLLSYFSFLWQNAIVYAIILLIVLAKPVGIFGRKIAKKV